MWRKQAPIHSVKERRQQKERREKGGGFKIGTGVCVITEKALTYSKMPPFLIKLSSHSASYF